MRPLQQLKDRQIDALLEWYRKNQRDLPWRRDPNPYWVWLAEIMSQQTQMATLVPYFHRFIERFPTIERLADAEEHEVLAAWAGLGYYSRARNVHRAAMKVVHELKGRFPRTLEGWLELPGVGPYTAAAAASQCFGVREPVWDGNVSRVCSRLEARADVTGAAFRLQMQDALREKMAGRDASDFNQAIMELGALVCTPKSPACARCPIEVACRAFAKDEVSKFPPPKARKKTIDLHCRVRVRVRGKRGAYEAFVQPRADHQWFAGLWDFPSELGGVSRPVERFETVSRQASSIGEVRHQITHHRIKLQGLLEVGNKANDSVTSGRWISIEELTADEPPVPLSTTARKILRLLLARDATDQLAMF